MPRVSDSSPFSMKPRPSINIFQEIAAKKSPQQNCPKTERALFQGREKRLKRMSTAMWAFFS